VPTPMTRYNWHMGPVLVRPRRLIVLPGTQHRQRIWRRLCNSIHVSLNP
jgi:hypothetical protein